ncbi:MAG: GreA/GreB family elongation factor [Acidobacteriia bacterium]|nr:GreA/GreB family elongation factor [Terriglobia bacterium]
MKSHSIVVSDADMDRLSRLVMALKHFLFQDQLQVESLNRTIESAEVASSEHIPRDIIRMNSRIHVLDLDTGKKELYTLVFPEHADISTSLISVLAPVGIALLGRRQGDIIEARVPGGIRRLRVERVLHRAGGKRVRPHQAEKEEPSLARNIQTAGSAA